MPYPGYPLHPILKRNGALTFYLGNPFATQTRHESGSFSAAGPGLPQAACPWNRDLQCKILSMLLFTVVFFALAFLYVKACQKLR